MIKNYELAKDLESLIMVHSENKTVSFVKKSEWLKDHDEKELETDYRYTELFRIRALVDIMDDITEEVVIKAGDIGGYVQDYDNLTLETEGIGWIFDDSIVYGYASITDSIVKNNSIIHGDIEITDESVIDNCILFGEAEIEESELKNITANFSDVEISENIITLPENNESVFEFGEDEGNVLIHEPNVLSLEFYDMQDFYILYDPKLNKYYISFIVQDVLCDEEDEIVDIKIACEINDLENELNKIEGNEKLKETLREMAASGKRLLDCKRNMYVCE